MGRGREGEIDMPDLDKTALQALAMEIHKQFRVHQDSSQASGIHALIKRMPTENWLRIVFAIREEVMCMEGYQTWAKTDPHTAQAGEDG